MTHSKLMLSSLVFLSLTAACGPASNTVDGGKLPDGGYPVAATVNLGVAGSFAILAKSGISTVPASVITGDLGISPAAATFVTGFSLIADATNTFSTSPQVTGKIYASDYTPPTPSRLTTAVGDMELAFTSAAGRAPAVTELGAGNIGGMTLTAGVYKWGTGLLIPTNVTLSGTANDVWIFQVGAGSHREQRGEGAAGRRRAAQEHLLAGRRAGGAGHDLALRGRGALADGHHPGDGRVDQRPPPGPDGGQHRQQHRRSAGPVTP